MFIYSNNYYIEALDYTINFFQKAYDEFKIYVSITIDMTDINFNHHYVHQGDYFVNLNEDYDIFATYEILKDAALEELSHRIYNTPKVYYPENQSIYYTKN